MTEAAAKQQHIGAMELFGVTGFSFFFAYELLCYFWLWTDFPPGYSGFVTGLVQISVFVGLSAALISVSLTKKWLMRPHFFTFSAPALLALGLILPLEAFLVNLGLALPAASYPVGGLCTGLAGGYFTLRWMDGAGMARIHRHVTFTSASIAGGAVLFFLVGLIVPLAQPLFAVVYLVASFGFLTFLRTRTDTTNDFTVKTRRDLLPFIKEVEPSIFTYGVVFGMGFALLFVESATAGANVVLWGMLAVFVGGAVVLGCDLAKVAINITLAQRAILVFVLAACLLVPFTSGGWRVLGLCL
ncbi:MAG: hypothetical protein LBR39_03880, partial [Coriobacteriales bacterium]|nr:hypothetical protein [Coriobacteriales bacterium]